MRVVDPGHIYELRVLDGEGTRVLTFVKREGDGYPGNVGHHPGTTSQEVLRALIERADYVNNQVPCAETEAAAELMKAALLLLEVRAARRHERIWEDFPTLDEAVLSDVCEKCGHIGCDGTCHP